MQNKITRRCDAPGRGMPGDTKAYSGVGRGWPRRGPPAALRQHVTRRSRGGQDCPPRNGLGRKAKKKARRVRRPAAHEIAARFLRSALTGLGRNDKERGGQGCPPRKTYVGPHRCGVWPVEIRDSGFQIGSTRPAPIPYGTCVSGTGWPRARWSPSWRRGRTGVSCRRGRPPGRACCSR